MQSTLIFTGKGRDAHRLALLDHDTETDTHHAQFRQYSSTQGRWMSPDPYDGSYSLGDPQSFNRYSYVGDRPLSTSDPSGLDPNCTGDEDGGDSNPGCEALGGSDPSFSDPSAGPFSSDNNRLCISGCGVSHPVGDPSQNGEPQKGCGVFCPGDTFGNLASNPFGFMTGIRFGAGGSAPNKSTICTPVFCPSNDTPAPAPPDPKDTACKAQAQAAEAKFAKNPKTFTTGAGASRILSTLQGSRLPGGSPLTWLKWLGAGEAFYLTWVGNDAMNQAFYDSVYRDCMSH